MYKKVIEYAEKHGLVSVPNSAKKLITAYINLDKNGRFMGIDVLDKDRQKKTICPDTGSMAFSGKNANPIVEKRDAVFNRKSTKHGGWLSIMRDASGTNDTLKILYEFINRLEDDERLYSEVTEALNAGKIKPDAFISFRIGPKKAEEQDVWSNWLSGYIERNNKDDSESPEIISSITGRQVKSVSYKTAPSVKASATGTGSYVAALTLPAFQSYGLKGNIGAGIGEDEALTIKTALESLLSDENHYDGRFNLLHWYDDDVEDIVRESLELKSGPDAGDDDDDDSSSNENTKNSRKNKDAEKNDEKLGELLQCALNGTKPDRLPDTSYFLCRYMVPTKGRQYITDQRTGTYESLFKNLSQWYDDTRIKVFSKKNQAVYEASLTNIYSLLFACMSDRDKASAKPFEKMDAMFGPTKIEILMSVYAGRQIPRNFYYYAVDKYTTSKVSGKFTQTQVIQIIKAYLIRKRREEGMEEKESTAYACGRLFAVYEKIQMTASGKLNLNLTERYFSAVQKAPQLIMSDLAELSVKHMKKIKIDSYKKLYNDEISEITPHIGTGFPKKFDDAGRGEFILGYYNERMKIADKVEALKAEIAAKKAKKNGGNTADASENDEEEE